METLINLISYLGVFSIFICILTIYLIWLFIRSAVASGTQKGILDAYDIISGNKQKRIEDDIEAEIKGWE